MMDDVRRPRLVASDVDGTLLDPMERVTERTARAISNVTAADTPFVLVSGRPPRWITPVASAANLAGYAVCSNGAVVYDLTENAVLSAHVLDPMLLHDVTHTLARAMPGVHVAAERADTTSAAAFATEPGYHNPWGDAENNTMSRAEVLGHAATKLLVRHSHMTSEEMVSVVHEVLDHAVDVTFSTNLGLIELSARGVTKALGLAEVCERLGMAAEDVVAFGDMPNDVAMLRWAGHGVAMANAHRTAIAAANEVTAANSEDGVAQVLERWF
jgi:Cof subfamily protein (haloacid dehalogenase superfamily)